MKVCLGNKLEAARTVTCLPLKYDWMSYTSQEKGLILGASKIYFPTIHYASVFSSLGKATFPSWASYQLLGDKVRQSLAFEAAGIPVPKTRLFTGRHRAQRIEELFSYPFVAKVPVGSSRGQGVFLIKARQDLDAYLEQVSVAYIQEYIELERDIRVVVLGQEAVLSYWKIASPGELATNVARGGIIDFDDVPQEAIELALEAAKRCSIDHAGFDICIGPGRGPLVLEANIHFGREGFEKAGLSYKAILSKMADSGRI
ncbi:MAG: ATP-grasp domain-containing protein [Thermodesulfobacteria bacterium]|nr:ATP-grasp domain-containing protein [Thermodesulfobacteriota bacterium]